MKKSQLIETLNTMSEDFTIEELVERLIVIEKIDRGMKDIKEGRSMSHEEVKDKFKKNGKNNMVQ